MSQVKGQLHYNIMLYDTFFAYTNSGAENFTFGQIKNCLLTFSALKTIVEPTLHTVLLYESVHTGMYSAV